MSNIMPLFQSFAIPPSAPSVSGIPTKGNDGTAIAENRRKNLENHQNSQANAQQQNHRKPRERRKVRRLNVRR
ncbi:hypothetical protein BIFADO_01575 [Bifidobacterium adolescentis L2-32]|uniref:Uncharacterized protein n=1 Tax=Bifidobacterium adolescentis L2-32 TaxID=411481 RepID=A7A6U3_BIFAD|nr:hypothetical protein BIFADO_01575 [Bifidobacterium adolescentis L2-32]